MKGDAQSFKRATVVAVLGLVLQALSAAAVAIYAGFSEGDHAAGSAAWHLAIGVLVWFPLVLLFDLHRRERRESIEIERMALEESAGVFEADETPRTARALEAFRKYALPGMSLLVGALLLGIGLLRFGGCQTANPSRIHKLFIKASASRSASPSRSSGSSSPGLSRAWAPNGSGRPSGPGRPTPSVRPSSG